MNKERVQLDPKITLYFNRFILSGGILRKRVPVAVVFCVLSSAGVYAPRPRAKDLHSGLS